MTRRTDLDAARALAAFAVVAVHAAAGAVVRGDAAGRTGDAFATGVLFDAAGRWCVPVFFAIAGWVLLAGKPVANGTELLTRVKRVAVALAVWSAVYAVWNPVWERTGWEQAWKTLPRAALGEPAAPQLWYLYAYIPLLLLLGAVTLLLRGRAAWVALVLLVGVAVLPTVVQLGAEVTGRDLAGQQWGLPLYAVAYAAAGAALLSKAPPLPRAGRIAAVAVFVAVTAAMIVGSYTVGYTYMFGYATVFVAVQSLAVLAAVNGATVPALLQRPVASAAEASFGVYLVHMLVLQALTMLLAVVGQRVGGIPATVSIPLLTVATFAVSWALAVAWGRAGLRKLLG